MHREKGLLVPRDVPILSRITLTVLQIKHQTWQLLTSNLTKATLLRKYFIVSIVIVIRLITLHFALYFAYVRLAVDTYLVCFFQGFLGLRIVFLLMSKRPLGTWYT